jgi:hypothetical protein
MGMPWGDPAASLVFPRNPLIAAIPANDLRMKGIG